MKTIKILSFLLTVTLLSSCGGKIEGSSQNTIPEAPDSSSNKITEESEPSSEIIEESSEPEESAEPVSDEAEMLTPEDFPELGTVVPMDWDYMMPAYIYSHTFTPSAPPDEYAGYYTVQKDGKWGLIREDGTLLLPCSSFQPVTVCSMQEWLWYGWADTSHNGTDLLAILEQENTFPVCAGHGGGSFRLFVEIGSDNTLPQYYGTESGSGGYYPLEPEELATMDYEPVYFAETVPSELTGTAPADNGYWNFVNGEGDVLVPDKQFDLVGEFGDEALAPVCLEGKWAYANKYGELITDFVHDSCWYAKKVYDSEKEYLIFPTFAYCLSGGCAPVLRDGKWGVIDSTGAEAVPCEYEGAAPLPGGAWLKKDGVWTKWMMN